MDRDTVLLFYREQQRDKLFRGDRHLRRVLRPAYNAVRRDAAVSGFLMWYRGLVAGLRKSGLRVVLNDEGLARRHPEHPVGLVGYTAVLRGWSLPNPAILGPGMYDHPALRPDLMDDVRFRLYLVTCEWMRDLFRPVYGDRVALWYGGIDLDSWPDASGDKKQYDVLVYDKIRWDRDRLVPDVLDRVVAALERRGLSYHVLRYGRYNVRTYRRLLSASRAMVFLCEHETQGLAYQEAMASNLPILAWDPGRWVDPRAPKLEPSIVPTTSVPHFSPACGERFVQAADFEGALDRFWDRLPLYQPRRYVEQNLSVSGSAELYMRYYRSLMPASTSSADLKPAV